ncbi:MULTISPECIES: hypothetical protein [unclassified Bacillus cereus group]|uniref:hypothetical protein n=1 Tax=unclassified Bacillus cereus group TaxID=2750818 RepID=UPI001F57289F
MIPNGQLVQVLGYTGTDVSCGGYASGRHVHFSLLQGNTRIPLQGKELGGWGFYQLLLHVAFHVLLRKNQLCSLSNQQHDTGTSIAL